MWSHGDIFNVVQHLLGFELRSTSYDELALGLFQARSS